MTTQNDGFVIRGKHVLFGVMAMFGVIIAVNLVFAYLAIETFTGLTDENPYQDGLAYNEVLADRAAQRDIGWHGDITLGRAGPGEDSITVVLTDAKGSPLSGLTLAGQLRRPTHGGMDQTLTWQEGAPGSYSARVALPRRGNWDLQVTADDGRNTPFEMKTRLWFR